MPGMWYELEKIFAASTPPVTIDKANSFFVGDAAGRVYSKSKKDFASTDRKWALNVELPFFTPEEFFLGLPPHKEVELPGLDVKDLPDCELALFPAFSLPNSFSATNPPILKCSPPVTPYSRNRPLCRIPMSRQNHVL